jgi:predicted glycoside hydrolase/deacetylase ChbG (UPF0249 family)
MNPTITALKKSHKIKQYSHQQKKRQESGMDPNPVLRKLGYSPNDRVIIIHTDDIGMCQASLDAFAEMMPAGVISSGAVMVPCPWFLAVAEYCRNHPGTDMGVHITLTSEWKNYRWGAISTREPGSGMVDEEGYFYPLSAQAQEHADPQAVAAEMAAQVRRALQAGVDVSHIDTHMGTVAHPKLMQSYIQIALENRIPAMMLRLDENGWRQQGLDGQGAVQAAKMTLDLESNGLPMLDQYIGMPLDHGGDRFEKATRLLNDVPPGLTHFILHPSKDTPELQAITDTWSARVADYVTFMEERLLKEIRKMGIQVIGYRALRNLMRK